VDGIQAGLHNACVSTIEKFVSDEYHCIVYLQADGLPGPPESFWVLAAILHAHQKKFKSQAIPQHSHTHTFNSLDLVSI
jgi:hypothetical protein